MINTVVVALSGALIAAATPAFADAARPGADTTTAQIASTKSAPKQAAHSSRQRYCVTEMVTGSRLPVKSCLTRDQWLAQGFDPLAK